MADLEIKRGEKYHAPLILSFITELAEEEGFPHAVTVTQMDLEQNLFGDDPAAEVLMFYADDLPAGFAVYYQTFSTTRGKRGLHLDDLYIRPQFRGQGMGKKALGTLAHIAATQECDRFEWWALEWNEMARDLYRQIGATEMKELGIFRLQGEEITHVARALRS